jgi:hypothetical protein
MRLRRIARPLARKGLSVIATFLLSEFPNFRWDLERRVTPVENRSDLTLNGNDCAPIGGIANPLVVWGGSEMLDVNLEADGGGA